MTTTATMTPDAKRKLSSTIRGLRERLIEDLHNAVERAYRLSVPAKDAGLTESATRRRARLDDWLDEQVRPIAKKDQPSARTRFLSDVVKSAASTLLNRLVYLRLLEANGLRDEEVVTGGWDSRGYKHFREAAPALVGDDTEGYAFLLSLVFEDLAIDLPGLYGHVGLVDLVPIPAATLRAVVDALDATELASCWTDDTTLGWVYQYWNDPEREALDAKLNAGGKVAPHEIASKTQMFTERYIVEWLLQNSLGQTWLAMCRKNGWTADAEAKDGSGQSLLDRLDARRGQWRNKREAGEVELTDLMPIDGDAEARWKYWVPQPMPDDAPEHAPASLRQLKLLDPACGSGHFLVIAFELLAALYQEEARHRGETWTDRQIAEWILQDNLHGVDIDPWAVQIAAAALMLKAKSFAADAHPYRLNLVAPRLRLASLPKDDPALAELEHEVESATGIPATLTRQIVTALEGADHLGTLLQVDHAVSDAVDAHEAALTKSAGPTQGHLFHGYAAEQMRLEIAPAEAKASVLDKLEEFLAKRTSADDLGLRLRGEQLAAGLRFMRIVKPATYDLVVGNPPYQGTSKMVDARYVAKRYPKGKADLYAAFLERGLQLVVPWGHVAIVTRQSWMFTQQYQALREHVLDQHDLRIIADLMWAAFENMRHDVIAMSVVRRQAITRAASVAVCPTPREERDESASALVRKRASLLCGERRSEFQPRSLGVISGRPFVYWWQSSFLDSYAAAPKLGVATPIRYGLSTQNNVRWLRKWWEVSVGSVMFKQFSHASSWDGSDWVPYVKGALGRSWIDDVSDVVLWRLAGGELWAYPENRWGRGTEYYFRRGVAFVNIGAHFSARAHRAASIFGHVAGSVFSEDTPGIVCLLNSTRARFVMQSFNPGLHFLTTDVARLPLLRPPDSDDVFSELERSFDEHECHRESSIEFRRPGPTAWRSTQEWAQRVVDRSDGASVPEIRKDYDPPKPTDFVSFAVGVALGRFGASGEGILDTALPDALPRGILFLSAASEHDSLCNPSCSRLHTEWDGHGPAIAPQSSLREYLQHKFFGDVHRKTYESRPIYFPLSSKKRSFVAYVSIHRWTADTLRVLLAEHLKPEASRLDGELADLMQAKETGSGDAARAAERRYAVVQKLKEELDEFVALVEHCAEKGPPKPDPKTPDREADARYDPDLDDGVMINSAALWPLLEPQWKDPKKWYKELATAKGRKDYDWSHLAARYWPKRVDDKCKKDPSLGVAHGCFWKYHPERAYAWELRLQDEIEPDFTIDEDGSDEARQAFLRDHPDEAKAIEEKEDKRRAKNRKKKAKASNSGDATQVDNRADSDQGSLFVAPTSTTVSPDDQGAA